MLFDDITVALTKLARTQDPRAENRFKTADLQQYAGDYAYNRAAWRIKSTQGVVNQAMFLEAEERVNKLLDINSSSLILENPCTPTQASIKAFLEDAEKLKQYNDIVQKITDVVVGEYCKQLEQAATVAKAIQR